MQWLTLGLKIRSQSRWKIKERLEGSSYVCVCDMRVVVNCRRNTSSTWAAGPRASQLWSAQEILRMRCGALVFIFSTLCDPTKLLPMGQFSVNRKRKGVIASKQRDSKRYLSKTMNLLYRKIFLIFSLPIGNE